jgi:hypothetical protein
MTKDEALKLALEALEKISRTHYHIETPPIESLEEKMRRIADKAITAIKQALAEPTVQEPVGEVVVESMGVRGSDAMQVRIHFYKEIPPVGSKVYTTPPAALAREDWGPGPHEYHSLPPAQPAVPDAIHHTDLSETLEYIQGWNDCRAEMLKGMKS